MKSTSHDSITRTRNWTPTLVCRRALIHHIGIVIPPARNPTSQVLALVRVPARDCSLPIGRALLRLLYLLLTGRSAPAPSRPRRRYWPIRRAYALLCSMLPQLLSLCWSKRGRNMAGAAGAAGDAQSRTSALWQLVFQVFVRRRSRDRSRVERCALLCAVLSSGRRGRRWDLASQGVLFSLVSCRCGKEESQWEGN